MRIINTNLLSGDNLNRKNFYIETFSGFDKLVELGVAKGETSKIFLSCVKEVVGIDIQNSVDLDHINDYANSIGSKFTFIHADDLSVEPIDCDILFIDTSHTEEHTYKELKKFSPHVKTFIALHDINPEKFDTLKGFNRWYAEEGTNWEEYYRDHDVCGLLVIKRKN